jgi:hypothetical protein
MKPVLYSGRAQSLPKEMVMVARSRGVFGVLACFWLLVLAPQGARGAAAQAPATASLAGRVQNGAGQALEAVTVQLRDLRNGELAGSSTTTALGSFGFAGLAAGNYLVEMVNDGRIMCTSVVVPLVSGAAVTGVMVGACPVEAPGKTAVEAVQPGAGGSGARSIGRAVIVLTAAAGAGIAAVVTLRPDASPSR